LVLPEEMNLEGLDENDPLSLPYLERGQRWMERQEAHSLRQALEDMDLTAEQRLHEAAQKEASELVWKHQNPKTAFRNPNAPYHYREHLRKESVHARTASWTKTAQDIQSRNTKLRSRDSSASRSVSGGSKSTSASSSRVPSDSSLKVPDSPTTPVDETSSSDGERQSRKRSVQFVEPEVATNAQKPDKSRARTLSPVKAPKPDVTVEKKKADGAPEVKISNVAVAVRVVSNTIPVHFRNPFARVRNTKGSLSRASTAPMPEKKGLNAIEIQKNPPSQSRNPAYTANEPVSPEKVRNSIDEEIKKKDGKEIRSDDIRKATSMSLKDRSPNLPTPTMVSDSPGRPIVSFKQNWKPKEVELKQELSSQAQVNANPKPCSKSDLNKPLPSLSRKESSQSSMAVPDRGRERTSPPPPPASSIPSIQVGDGPGIPTISVNNGPRIPSIAVNKIPSISVNAPSITVAPPSISINQPTISVHAPPGISINGAPAPASRRPLPIPSKAPGRPSPHHAATAPVPSLRNKTHFTPTSVRASGALCANCALPISGRIVSAAGVRFHPECFRCHHCAEGLECVAFYPEPDNFRSERVSRIRARMAGQYVEERVGQTEHEDGDETLRFYCHLDFHEFFSPRCKSCKTPIEGEVVVACGAEWHVGHFFCAQCGDVLFPSFSLQWFFMLMCFTAI
jgi:paxillin